MLMCLAIRLLIMIYTEEHSLPKYGLWLVFTEFIAKHVLPPVVVSLAADIVLQKH